MKRQGQADDLIGIAERLGSLVITNALSYVARPETHFCEDGIIFFQDTFGRMMDEVL